MDESSFVLITILACSVVACVSGSQELCQQVCQRVSNDVCDTKVDIPPIQPMRGKHGPKGEKGEPGYAGAMDVDGAVSTVLIRIAPVLDEMNTKVDEMKSAITRKEVIIMELQQQVRDLRQRQGLCKVYYGGKCFWSVIKARNINKIKAQEICSASMGAKLANVYSRLHYDMLMDYMRPLIGPDDYRDYVWTGMKYNEGINQVTYSNGTQAAFVKWHSGYPQDRPGNSEICLLVNKDASSANQGFYNQLAISGKKGVLCELEA